MRRFLASGLVAVIALVAAACNSQAPAASDPYQLVWNGRNAGWDQVQVDVAFSAQTGSGTISLPPGSVRLVLDTKAGKGAFHLSVPKSALGPDASQLTALGITGDTIDVDVLYDGQALYAKSPLAPALVQMLFAQGGQAPSGDLTGWLKLMSKADFEALAALGTGGAIATSAPIPSFVDANAMHTALTDAGVTLTYVGTGQFAGVNADHLTVAIDWDKLAASSMIPAAQKAQVAQGVASLKDVNLTIDLWLDHSSNKFIGFEAKGADKTDPTQTLDLTVSLKAPDGGTSLDSPASSVEVPLMQILGQFMGGQLPTP